MAIASSPSPTYLPISALLPPSREPHSAPHHPLPSPSAAILGPLPPTTPLHLALNWLSLSGLPEYESSVRLDNEAGPSTHQAGPVGVAAAEGGKSERRKRRPERVLIINGRKDEFYQVLQDDDEDWMRDHGSDYTVLDRLKRVDIRYCPSPAHLTLLLSLLTPRDHTSAAPAPAESTFMLESPPGLVVFWDLAGLLMEWEGMDENALPDDGMDGLFGGMQAMEPKLRFKKSVKLSDYLDLIAASRATVDHISSSDPSRPPTQLIVLEPNLDAHSSLPVLLPSSTATCVNESAMSSQVRQKRIKILDGLRWILGEEAIGVVSPFDTIAEDIHAPQFQLDFAADPETTCYIKQRRCGRGEWARPALREGDTDGDRGGWRWEWA